MLFTHPNNERLPIIHNSHLYKIHPVTLTSPTLYWDDMYKYTYGNDIFIQLSKKIRCNSQVIFLANLSLSLQLSKF